MGCVRIYTTTLKPNSALRKVARVRLSNGFEVTAYIPAKGIITRTLSCIIAWRTCKRFTRVRYHILRGNLDTQGVATENKEDLFTGRKNLNK